MEKLTVSLCDGWKMRRADETQWLPATVPGSVYADLLSNGKMDDPYDRDNETAANHLMDYGWVYEKTFSCPANARDAREVFLRFEGLDTAALIELNGSSLGRAENMHRVYEFDVTKALRDGENRLTISFDSPNEWMERADKAGHLNGSTDCTRGFSHLRKAHCMSGWDWGPRLPDCGIWRPVSLVLSAGCRLNGVLIRQTHEKDAVTLRFFPELTGDKTSCETRVTVISPEGALHAAKDGALVIKNPALWWPRGYGAQPLYTVRAELVRDGEVLDTWEKRIGLRTLTMRREKDDAGESFEMNVNGVSIFTMGADYIPQDNILSRVTKERTRRLLEDCALANFNAVRVWGGGYYPEDFFFDCCDELGIVVWQDFMFACAAYSLTPDFDRNIRAEFEDNIRRLRHHPSLALWCGNNEVEEEITQAPFTDQDRADYIKIFEYILPATLEKLDPDRFYWPSSPSSGGNFFEPRSDNYGDVHDWSVWHGGLPFTAYRNHLYRFVSEFGFQSFPCLKTVESFTAPDDRNIFSYVMEKHQRNNAANGKILGYLSQTFQYPADFDTLLYASQLLQMEAVRYGVEHWRRNRGRCMGAIYWQLNDCWPVASWASIDYFSRWKALHYAAKRFFAPVLLSCCEEGTLTQETNVNAQLKAPLQKSVRLNVSNETRRDVRAVVRWALRDASGAALETGEETMVVPALSAKWLDQRSFPNARLYGDYVSFELIADGALVSSGTALFCAPKHFRFTDPHLRVTVNGDAVTVSADAYARSVELVCGDGDVLLEDNYFDLNADSRTVRILRGTGAHFTARSVYDIR